ncbi:MAG TPA: cytochrome P450 [Polyangiaceae bacterium]|jgi:cytochrome P450
MSILGRLETAIGDWLTSTDTLRAASAELRKLAPITVAGGRTFVFRRDDVAEVLGNERAFGVTEIYADRMARTTGTFFLGMEDTPRYRREVGLARGAVKTTDAAAITSIVTSRARELVGAARARGGVIDAVSDFTRLVPLRLVETYLGVPGPDPDTMKRWMRNIFWDIFLNQGEDAAVREKARGCSDELRPYLLGLVAERRRKLASCTDVDDFVTRLVREQAADPTIDDDLLRRNIGGVIVGAVDTQSKAMAHALDQLLRRPAALESARRAALANDMTSLRAHIWEALRFDPLNPVLFRKCHADTVVADGTRRRTVIEAGSMVVAFTLSAMFDEEALTDPNEFRLDRPSTTYMHFGFGQHTCFGAFMNGVVLPAAMRELLVLEGLAYDEDGPGKIEYEGPFPDRMKLRFDVPR